MSDRWFRPLSPVEKWRWLDHVLQDPRLPTSARAVAAALACRHNSESGRLDPGTEDLARRTKLSRRGAQLARDQLVAAGYLAKVMRSAGHSGAGNRTNAYRLILEPRLHREAAGDTVSLRSLNGAVNETSGEVSTHHGETGGAVGTLPGAVGTVPSEVTTPLGEVSAPEPVKEQVNIPIQKLILRTPAESDWPTEKWRRFQEAVAGRLGETWWKAWGRQLTYRHFDDGILTIEAANKLVAKWVRGRLSELRIAAVGAGLPILEIRIRVAASDEPMTR